MRTKILLTSIIVLASVNCPSLLAQTKDPPPYRPAANADQALQRLEELGAIVRRIALNDNALEVDFRNSTLTDAHLQYLHSLIKVNVIRLRETRITDAGLVHLGKITTLKRLHLEKTAVTDAGLRHLTGLNELELLNLFGTEVGDAGLMSLKTLPRLKSLFVSQTKVTAAGIAQLKKAILGLQVVPDPVQDRQRVEAAWKTAKSALDEAEKRLVASKKDAEALALHAAELKEKLDEAVKQTANLKKKADEIKKQSDAARKNFEDAQKFLVSYRELEEDARAQLKEPKVAAPAMIVVEVNYPGANAKVVADTVAAPIEQQVNGVENSLRLESRSSNDGRYLLAITFKPGTDLDKTLVLVQKRIVLAMPILPNPVQTGGITVRKKAPVRMILNLASTDNRYDLLYLSNYAATQIKDELARIPCVSQVTLIGQRDYHLSVQVDLKKLAAFKIVAGDVVRALEEQNLKVAGGQKGQPPMEKGQGNQLTLKSIGRLSSPEELGNVILQTDSKGTVIRLKDVAKVELAVPSTESQVSLNGKPGVVLCIYPTGTTNPKDLSRGFADRVAELRAKLPKGLRLDIAFDFTPNLIAPNGPKTTEYLLLDLQCPVTSSANRVFENLKHSDKLLREIRGVQDVLALTENPFDILCNQPCLLVRLASTDKRKTSREEIVRTIRTKLEKVPGAVLHLRDPSRQGAFSLCGYPIDFAVIDSADRGQDKMRELAEKFAERLQKSKKLTDVWVNPDCAPRPMLYLDIDRDKAKDRGLSINDINSILQVMFGSFQVNDFNRFGRTWQINVQAGDKIPRRVEDIKQIKVRNNKGQMVPFSDFATVRTLNGPGAIIRVDMWPAVLIAANPVAEVSLVQARKLCETLFEQMRKESLLPAGYRLIWLRELPTK